MWTYNYTEDLYHHGVKGMKWGRRRYQNKDGSLTPAGEKHYGDAKARLDDAERKRAEYEKKTVDRILYDKNKGEEAFYEWKQAKGDLYVSDSKYRKLVDDVQIARNDLKNVSPKQKSIGKTIVGGILTDIGVSVCGGMASGVATRLGHDAVAQVIKMGTIGASVGIKVNTVKSAIAAGKHNNQIRNS